MVGAVRRSAWLDERASLFVVTVLAVLWAVAILAFPEVIRWLRVDANEKSLSEGPCEWAEDVLLVGSLALWFATAWWSRRDPARLAVAVLMTVQVALILGEELDWGRELGLAGFVGERNLRRIGFARYGISENVGSLALMVILGLFFAWPLVSWGAPARWLARVAPVHAGPGDALALFALPLLCLIMTRIGAPPSVEFVQIAGYLVLTLVSLRVSTASRRASLS